MSQDLSSPQPFRVEIADDEVERMKRIIEDTRLPDSPPLPNASWDYGVDLDWLKGLRDVWLNDFDWKEVEREMNAFHHFTVTIESVSLHFVHHQSRDVDAIPIILMHGWPGSFWEFHRVIELLTNPPSGRPAFHVVVPSLPGFGFSSPPPKKDWSMGDNARIFDHLMTGVLGYKQYMAEGGDFGALIATHLGTDKYPACKFLNVVSPTAQAPLGALSTLPFFLLPTSWRQWLYGKIYSEDELRDFERNGKFIKNGLGYFVEQATRPLTIGYALYDSPVGILAWIGEKFKEHVDPEILPGCTRFILTTVSLYYLTRTFTTSTLPYFENVVALSQRLVITKPFGSSRFPHDVGSVPMSWIKRQHPQFVSLRRHDRGGHFPGFEVPDLLAEDLQHMAENHRTLFR
ncbi:hypothetical protein EW026_g2667 [Hermanssonia centrifuga]|uniref:Epoxide hydrolase N-terminal domain-containing protein n=1 Tax=Hermanssonia centrifuga TaxID=98765 RepID=A0A4S4KN69_9APHY|nr:hypothetical protein EW026_g2667 [Hermanssonia centrifuga]